MIRPRRQRLREQLIRFVANLVSWFTGDFAYAVLPIGVIALLTVLLHGDFSGFLLIKEWLFASIVLFGVSIRRLIHLKVQVQLVPTSITLDGGVQLYILLLIASVLVLAIVLLAEKRMLQLNDTQYLAEAQIGLFAISAWSVLAAIMAEDNVRSVQARLEGGASRRWLLRHLVADVQKACGALDKVASALEIAASYNAAPSNDVTSRRSESKHEQALKDAVNRADVLLKQIQDRVEPPRRSSVESSVAGEKCANDLG